MRKIVVTDLDGTLLARDSYYRAIFKFGRRMKPLLHLPRFLIGLTLYAAKLKNRSHLKALSFRIYFKGVSTSRLLRHRHDFINSLEINQAVLDKVREYQQNGYEIYIVTASPDLYVKEITDKFGFNGYLCTKVDWQHNRLSGKLISDNCINEEKVRRIREDLLKNETAHIVAFGNSKGDHAMFKLADYYYYVKKGLPVKNHPF